MQPGKTIAYISDVGAGRLKPLFITGAVLTAIFLDLSFVSERWLRHRGRLAPNTTRWEKMFAIVSMVFALVGTLGLIMLTIFDTAKYRVEHDIFLLLFIAGYVISAIFICAEYQRLGKSTFCDLCKTLRFALTSYLPEYRDKIVLRASFWTKLMFILLEVSLGITFVVCSRRKKYNACAVLEWIISFVFTFYVISFFIDLIPAVHTRDSKRRICSASGEPEMQMGQNNNSGVSQTPTQWASGGIEPQDDGDDLGSLIVPPHSAGRDTMDSERTLGFNDVRVLSGLEGGGEHTRVARNT